MRSRRIAIGGLAGAILILSLPWVAARLTDALEKPFPPKPLPSLPKADAIVVLGGTTSRELGPPYESEEIFGSRLLAAARLFRAGKAPIVLATGGKPYRGWRGDTRTESTDMKEVLVAMKVPAAAVIEESRSRSTLENAEFSLPLLYGRGAHSILLVTSAEHLRRAVRCFERGDLTIIPVPAGWSGPGDLAHSIPALLPNPLSLLLSSLALREIVLLPFTHPSKISRRAKP